MNGRNLLVVDDDQIFIDLVTRLARDDFAVLSAMNGKKALEIAGERAPDFILLDICLPDADGYTLCKSIRKMLSSRPLQIILVSGKGSANTLEKVLEAGADDFIKKPFSKLEFSLRMKAADIRLKAMDELLFERDFLKQAVFREERLSNKLLDERTSLKEAINAVNEMKKTLEAANRKLEKAAKYDALSGLLNRTSLMDRVQLEAGKADATESSLSGIMIDLDHFKAVNDSHGHAAGDEFIREVGKCLKSLLRKGDFAGRYGGEEFFVILPETEIGSAAAIAERIRAGFVEIRIAKAGPGMRVSASLGVATRMKGENYKSWMDRADMALYAAKEKGRNRVETSGI
jgi:diguanylate cyclase (GGDEF)-like protein